MGVCESKKKKLELGLGRKPVPLKTAFNLSKSICKIIDQNNNHKKYGTGFFMIYHSLKCLISNYHVISYDLIIEILKLKFLIKKGLF